MAKILTKNVQALIRQLITNISGFDETSEHFETVEDFAFSHVASPDYYFNYSRNDIEQTINNLSEKFQFHGFLQQAEALKTYTNKFFNSSSYKEDLEIRVSVLKLLLNISHSPTTHFTENPEYFKPKTVVEEEEITDWASYLNDTKVQTVQTFSDTSDEEWSDDEDFTNTSEKELPVSKSDETDKPTKSIKPCLMKKKLNLQEKALHAKDELLKIIQAEWWNKENVVILPTSEVHESKVALEWDKFVNDATMGLVRPETSIIPEYKIMRELIWQFFAPNTCFSFGFDNGKIVPKSGMSISSVRPQTFQYFLYEFVPYIEMLSTFRTFQESLHGDYFVISIPDTYRSYACALAEILGPVFVRIKEIEHAVLKQEKPTTILSIANDLRPYFKNLELLYTIHVELTKEFNVDNSFKNATYLLSRLYCGLLNSLDKTEQNILLTLYLHSLYKYFTTVELWLAQDMLHDPTDEFIIVDKSGKVQFQNQDWQMEYSVRQLDSFSEMDGMLHIICTKVLQLAKNIHLLRLLGKLHLIIDACGSNQDTLYDEFVKEVLSKAQKCIKNNAETEKEQLDSTKITSEESTANTKKFTVICPEQKTSEHGMDSIENFLDFSDSFLATVFEPYLNQQAEPTKNSPSLYQLIESSLTKLFPVKQILEATFLEVLQNRYSVPGLMVKNSLIDQYQLKKHFGLMKHLYLFEDDIIFPFYKKMFGKFESQQMWGNFFWLTSQLQDLLMDLYPEFYEDCRVDVEPNWRLCTDPIVACELVSVHCRINWPVNVIIRREHISKYHEVFQFILKLKWAMNTLNRLSFLEIEPRNKPFKHHLPLIRQRIRKLESLKFLLVNDVSSIQHYVLGHLFNSLWKKFDKDLSESYDLESLVNAHDKFIHRIFIFCVKLRDEKRDTYGFGKVLTTVQELYNMWHDLYNLDDNNLKICEVDYQKCHKYLRPIIEMDIATF